MTQTEPPLARRRVLVLEDDYLLAGSLTRGLRAAGANVVGPYPNVRQALSRLEREGYAIDAAVLDLDLRGETSYRLADVLIRRGVPVAFVTGREAGAIHPAWREQPCLAKPVDEARLVSLLAGAPDAGV